jgi:hypothetical protein
MDSIRNGSLIRKPSTLNASQIQRANLISANITARVQAAIASAMRAPALASVVA